MAWQVWYIERISYRRTHGVGPAICREEGCYVVVCVDRYLVAAVLEPFSERDVQDAEKRRGEDVEVHFC